MTLRHKPKSARRRAKARIARQAWKNYAALNSWKAIFDGNHVSVVRKLNGTDQHSTKISIFVHPMRIIANPSLMAWTTDLYEDAAARLKQAVDDHLIDALTYGTAHYRVGRATRAK